MTRLRDQRGEISLISLLMGMTIMLVVGAAVLTTFDVFNRVQRDHVAANESSDVARRTLDGLARELRNLASPTPEQPQAVDRATDYDLIFLTVDPGVPAGANVTGAKRVRYCLEPAGGRLFQQSQTWTSATPPPVPTGTACPASGWSGAAGVAAAGVAAAGVVNREDGGTQAAFASDGASLTDIASLHVDLLIDGDRSDDVAASRLSTGVFLRNQNRRPVAAFTATRTAQGILLNGSASADPEGQTLSYHWFDGTTSIGTGVTATYAAPAGTTRQLSLRVTDPAALAGVAPVQAVVA